MGSVKIQIKKNRDGSFRFKPVGGNGEPLNDRYTRRSSAVKAAKKFKAQIASAIIVNEKLEEIK